MENRKSLLKLSSVEILPNLSIRIPTVEEILEDEFSYYGIIHSLTASPFQYMVQLDNIGIDFTTISDYQLFMMLFTVYAKSDLSIIFGDLDTSDFIVQGKENCEFLYSTKNKLVHHCINNRVKLYCQWYTLISPFKRICRNIILFDETQDTFFQLLHRLIVFSF